MEGRATVLSFREKFGYGLGDTASNFFFQVFNIFLLYYYTDIFGLTPAAVGTMFIVTKVVDAVSDPVMGLIADRTNSRWGKFRPYLLWAAVPYGIMGYAMFANPDFTYAGKLVYAYATYTLMMLAYTTINIPYSALMGVISPSSAERTKVASFRFICAFGAAWLIGTFVTPLKNILGGGDEANGFRLTMMIFAVISIGLFWVTFATTKERVKTPQKDSNLKSDFGALMSNGPWLALFLAAIFTLMNLAVRNGAIIYYFKYYVGDDGSPIFLIFDKTAVFMSSGLFAMIAGVAFTKFLSNRFGKRNLLIALSSMNAVLIAAFFFIPPQQYGLMIFVNCIGAFISGPTPALVWAMYADCADYGEWKTGRRTTALIFSALQFAQKMGLAVGAGVSGFILALFGFVANTAQSDSSMLGIRLMFSLFPALLAILGIVAVVFYRLSEEQVSEIEIELEKRREENS
ncbi:MAG: MFS transporter [Opitutales bacterium]|jgi:GPH family glycoside/pentoside/hexuronide:cation symporter|nr:MFS transporter [Opitutales bacterium]MBT5815364.1 MFS transporter [Opitutales bacterium]MBT6381093.1 MFS transporter [Opitutales bacterium]MBT7867382.1 MFS transporter [Opitutales bacterium]